MAGWRGQEEAIVGSDVPPGMVRRHAPGSVYGGPLLTPASSRDTAGFGLWRLMMSSI